MTRHTVIPDILGLGALRELVAEAVIKPTLGDLWRPNVRLHINPAGTFHTGGPGADPGLTGRKIIVDRRGYLDDDR